MVELDYKGHENVVSGEKHENFFGQNEDKERERESNSDMWLNNTQCWPMLFFAGCLLAPSMYNYIISTWVNPLSPDCEENGISLYLITTCSNIQVIRIKEVITKDKMS